MDVFMKNFKRKRHGQIESRRKKCGFHEGTLVFRLIVLISTYMSIKDPYPVATNNHGFWSSCWLVFRALISSLNFVYFQELWMVLCYFATVFAEYEKPRYWKFWRDRTYLPLFHVGMLLLTVLSSATLIIGESRE